jgi:ABC-type sugar transport system permease subunit
MKRKQMSLSTKSAWTAQLFILPFYLGFLFFFFSPLLESLRMSFSNVAVDPSIGYQLTDVGFANYRVAFLEDASFTTSLTNSFSSFVLAFSSNICVSSKFIVIHCSYNS